MLCALLSASLLLAPLAEMAPEAVDAYLAGLDEIAFDARFARVVQDGVGTPYADGPLGEGPEGKYDQDPLMDLSRVDCVTFVEQSVALATAKDHQAAFDTLQRIRYKDGAISFESRNHFMVSDWLESNSWCREMTGDLGVPTETVTRTISRKDFFVLVKAPKLGQDTPDRDVTLRYVPSAAAAEAVGKIPSPALILFIGNVDWLFSLHTGVFLRDETGTGRLYHASSKAGAVVAVDLAEYVTEQQKRYRGFSVYALGKPPCAEAGRRP